MSAEGTASPRLFDCRDAFTGALEAVAELDARNLKAPFLDPSAR